MENGQCTVEPLLALTPGLLFSIEESWQAHFSRSLIDDFEYVLKRRAAR